MTVNGEAIIFLRLSRSTKPHRKRHVRPIIVIIIIHTFITRTTSNGEERITGAGWSRGYGLNDKLKKWVLSLSLKLLREVQFRISRGISFHTVGAATEKARLAKTVPQ